jgi:hypothetical protein
MAPGGVPDREDSRDHHPGHATTGAAAIASEGRFELA